MGKNLGFSQMTTYWAIIPLLYLLTASRVHSQFLYPLLEKPDKGATGYLLVLYQTPDLKHGFDRFELRLLAYPSSRPVKKYELASEAERQKWATIGMIEPYLQQISTKVGKIISKLQSRGYKPVCRLQYRIEGNNNIFQANKQEIRLAFLHNQRSAQTVVRLYVKGKKRTLRRFRCKKVTGYRGFEVLEFMEYATHLLVLNRGKVLGLVVRYRGPLSPTSAPREDIYFFPLRRTSKKLGLHYPWRTECIKKMAIPEWLYPRTP